MAEIHVHHSPKKTKKLLNPSSKTLKFILTFLIDMLPVIVGILIAVAINSSREKQKDKQLEQFYLSSIKNSLEEDIQSLKDGRGLYEEVERAQKYILRYYREGNFNKDSMYPNITIFLADAYPDLNNIGFTTLQNTGKLDIISDKETLSDLIEIYQVQLPRLQRLVDLYLDYKRNQLIPLINSNFLISTLESKKLLDQIQFRNIMMQLPLSNIISAYSDLITQHQKLLDKLSSTR